MPFRQTSVSGYPAIALRGSEIEVVAVPTLGLKLTNLRSPRGREWLWRNDQVPLAPPSPGAGFVEEGDSGGWDECFPTVAPSRVPGAPAGTPSLPDHGELSAPALRVPSRGDGGPRRAAGPAALPAPPHGQCADAVHGRDDLARNDVVSWPAGIAGQEDGFRFPGDGGWAVKCFGDVGPSGRMLLTDPRRSERLEIRVRPAEVPQVGVWINCRGWAPPGRRPYYNLALEPSIGAPDSLEAAVQEWGTARTLAPGEVREWEVEVALGR